MAAIRRRLASPLGKKKKNLAVAAEEELVAVLAILTVTVRNALCYCDIKIFFSFFMR